MHSRFSDCQLTGSQNNTKRLPSRIIWAAYLLVIVVLLATACSQDQLLNGEAGEQNNPAAGQTNSPVKATLAAPPPTATNLPTRTPEPTPSVTPQPTATPVPQYATLNEFWEGNADWVLDEYDTGLPLGESDTVYRRDNEFWSYLHASDQSAGVVDQCGDPVPFPGCTTLWKSYDEGRTFSLEDPTCLFACAACPCTNERDHIAQQQYPRVSFQPELAYLVYEHGAYNYLRTSPDGLQWSQQEHVPGTWIWTHPYGICEGDAVIGIHPHIHEELQYDCLVGGPPGIYIEGDQLFIFTAVGQAPGHMGCFSGSLSLGAPGLQPCSSNPLFGAENGYGPVEARGLDADPYFEFRTISSADVVKVGDHYYMTYEGVRGPSSYEVVDDQFALGLARSVGPVIDGEWETYPGNPIIMHLPGNVGVGHADIVVVDDITYLYTATSDTTRGRYVLLRQ